ncbi:hypothetical protein BDZ89DRAFT_1124597 [Hymenopellis radicata]|nr:hypothetical protein BDZ89DRAFT_1124597 [Hymenopellis radicata]
MWIIVVGCAAFYYTNGGPGLCDLNWDTGLLTTYSKLTNQGRPPLLAKLSGDVLGEEEREAGIVDTGWFGVKSRLGENSRRDGFRKGRHTKVWERKPNRHGQPKTWVEG